MTYTEADKATYDPGPCPHCGGTDVRVDWVHVPSDQALTGDEWAPSTSWCLNRECPARWENERGEAFPRADLGSAWDNADQV